MISLCVVAGFNPVANAAPKGPQDTRARVTTAIQFECAKPEVLAKAGLRRALKATLRRRNEGVHFWGDRAFAYDLNGDSKSEYVVPLDCSAVGNCYWGVFAANPARLLGLVYGETLYPRKCIGQWPAITTASHISTSVAMLATYCFRNGRYKQCCKAYEVGAYRHNEPGFMERVQPVCVPGWRQTKTGNARSGNDVKSLKVPATYGTAMKPKVAIHLSSVQSIPATK